MSNQTPNTPEIIASSKPSTPSLENGTYEARCFRMVSLGTQTWQYQGKTSTAEKVMLFFELPNETYTFEDETTKQQATRVRVLTKEFTLSMGKKANLRKFLANWRGKDFDELEAKAFNIVKLLGQFCLITVVANEGGYSEITAATKPTKSTVIADPVHPQEVLVLTEKDFNQKLFDSLPEWIQKKIIASPEHTAIVAKQAQKAKPAQVPPQASKKAPQAVPVENVVGEGEDDLPF
jgi:hypothetical protein